MKETIGKTESRLSLQVDRIEMLFWSLGGRIDIAKSTKTIQYRGKGILKFVRFISMVFLKSHHENLNDGYPKLWLLCFRCGHRNSI
jgi:hypothetical protein